jgi:hypothetical protein
MVGVSDDLDRVAGCEKVAQSGLDGKASAARSQPYCDPSASQQGKLVVSLSKALNIPLRQIVTMGDMPNDTLMFNKSGFSIAMGNSCDEVKARSPTVMRTKGLKRRYGSLSCARSNPDPAMQSCGRRG